jgi:GNAT superfamily N-acetyltransferase
VTGTYHPPVLLEPSHELDGFACRSVEQTEWLRRHARASSRTGTTRVLVVTPAGSDVVVAYYAWCMASVSLTDAPPRMRKGAGRYPQPVALLARLGVDGRHEGQGIGAGLVQDVVGRTHALGEEIGCRGLLVHAETAEARDFYLHLVPEFETSPTDELHLILLMKDIRRTLA